MFKMKQVYTLNILYVESIHNALTVQEYVKKTIKASYSKRNIFEKFIVGGFLKTYLNTEGRPSYGFYKFEIDLRGNEPKTSLTPVDF